MKLEQLIVQYLYNNKKVSIQDIGIFTLSPDIVIVLDSEKETILPEGAIKFEYNSKAEKDDDLIDFIVQHSRKIKPLATSDLESYSLLSRQFLNIGKPMIIEGIGTLQKNQQGTYDFVQGHTVNPKLPNDTVTIREKIQDEISFSTPPKEPASKKGIMLMVVAIFLFSLAGALYYFFVYNKNKDILVEQEPVVLVPKDTMVTFKDTTATIIKNDSLTPPAQIVAAEPQKTNDGYSFKIVIKEYSSLVAADKAYKKLSSFGHKLLITTTDSTNYKLSMPFTSPISDTLRAKDSLRSFFGGKPYVQL